LPALNAIIRNRFFINVCQWVMLGVFIALLFTLFIPGNGLNIASLMIWGLWWPGLVIATLALGRIWCAVCPLKLLSVIAGRFRLSIPDKNMRDEKMWSLLFSFMFAHLLMLQFSLVYNSSVTGLFLCILLVTSAYSGLSRRLFCHTMCPLGLMLSCYRLCSPMSFGILESSACESCGVCTVFCTETENKTKFYSQEKGIGDIDCTLCFTCARKCPKRNIGYKWLGFFRRIKKETTFTLPKGLFLVFLFCLMLSEWLGEIPGFESLLLNSNFLEKMSFTFYTVYVPGKVPLFFLLLPFFLWFFPVSLYGLLTGWNLKSFFTKYSVFFVSLVASIHIAKSAIKLNVLLPFLCKLEHIKLYVPYAGIDAYTLFNEDILLLCITLCVFCIGVFSVVRMDKEYYTEWEWGISNSNMLDRKTYVDAPAKTCDHIWLVGLFLLFLTLITSLVILVVFAKKGPLPSFDIC